MAQKYKRNRFVANKYQKNIIAIAFFPALIICVFITIVVVIFYQQFLDVIVNNSMAQSVQFVEKWSKVIAISLWALFLLIIVWAYDVSSSLVGAFERIIKELDDVIENKQKRSIKARPGDDLANEILKRVNKLIEDR